MAAKVVPPRGIPSWSSDQPRHAHLPAVPLRMVVAGPSGCGKTIMIVALIMAVMALGAFFILLFAPKSPDQ
jgi:hypothetical protein